MLDSLIFGTEIKDHIYNNISLLAINKEGEIIFANTICENLLHYLPGELIGLKVEELLLPEFQEKHINLRKKYFEEKHVPKVMLSQGRLIQGVKKNGDKIDLTIILSPFFKNRIPYVAAILIPYEI